jgi:glutamyl-tRNA reductase
LVNIMEQGPIALRQVTVCGWSTVGLDRAGVDSVGAEAQAAHPGALMLGSCQRLEAFGENPCACNAPERWQGREAIQHLAEVAAGLHSAVLGEEQILAQVRAALADAGGSVREAGDIAIAAARELRRSTNFDSHAGHLLDRSLKVADVPAAGSVLVLGTGAMGRLVARRAAELGFFEITIAGRTEPQWLGDAPFAKLSELDPNGAVDVLVGCLGSGAGTLDLDALPKARRLTVDLGTPRNFSGSSAAPLLSIAELIADEASRPHAMRRRDTLRAQVATIVERRLGEAAGRTESPVAALRYRVEIVRQREAERVRRLHPEIEAETVEQITRALVNQIFHTPSERLKADPALAEDVLGLFAEE